MPAAFFFYQYAHKSYALLGFMSSSSHLLSASFGVQVSVSECAAFLLIIDLYVDMEYFVCRQRDLNPSGRVHPVHSLRERLRSLPAASCRRKVVSRKTPAAFFFYQYAHKSYALLGFMSSSSHLLSASFGVQVSFGNITIIFLIIDLFADVKFLVAGKET